MRDRIALLDTPVITRGDEFAIFDERRTNRHPAFREALFCLLNRGRHEHPVVLRPRDIPAVLLLGHGSVLHLMQYWRVWLAEFHAQGVEVHTIPYEPTKREEGAARRTEQQHTRQWDGARVRAQQLAQTEASQEKKDQRTGKGMKPRTTPMPHLARHAADGHICTDYLVVRDIGAIDPSDPSPWL